ncbi:hypothetical protein [Pseudomonas matsuisoli]|uniref:hypothetical protein n=1 Tax=Pseudomonas matsuisoli TaxID=1515666 RepID=UPI00166D383B|nr:hypothetical protein [Pseudomonas matsuisoli]
MAISDFHVLLECQDCGYLVVMPYFQPVWNVRIDPSYVFAGKRFAARPAPTKAPVTL